ncbi:MAG: phosphodiester glycosidase family protein [Verrucomicrobiales bacterium]|nr:phosphodiester glycosidase family protein [Verrucomicrobiales bacterium]
MFRYLIASVFLLSPALRAEVLEHEGTSYHLYRFNPSTENLELHLSGEKNKPNRFTELEEKMKAKGRRLKFAMNSGIFEGTFLPTGLHIAGGKTIVPLNTDDFVKEREGQFTPNFFLKPNGVFYLMKDGQAGILETSKYQQANIRPKPLLATQSGPLLVQDRKIHPVLTKDSTSIRYRNGVGVTTDGKIIFACSVLNRETGMSNLYNFAEMFRDKLNCPNALYLDGDISYIYIRDITPPLEDTNFFAGILAITEPVPKDTP